MDNSCMEKEQNTSAPSPAVENEVPTFKSIAEKIRREKLKKNISKTGVPEEDEDGHPSSKRARGSEEENGEQLNGEDEEGTKINKRIVSKHELRQELFHVLKKFFKCAFTIIIKRRKLCPSDAFQTTSVWGVNIPRFLHPSSLEYVEEVAKKLILFLHRNCSEGCAIHIMIERNKTLHVVQRFVFRTMGSLDDPNTAEQDIDIDEVKARCKASLLQLLNADTIKPMSAPQYARWSISIGINKDFLVEDNVDELWSHDPSGNYFPWKEKLRSLANVNKKSNYTTLKTSYTCPANLFQLKSVQAATDGGIENSECSINEETKESSPVVKEVLSTSDVPSQSDSSANCNNRRTQKHNIQNSDASKIICFPLSSFPITSNSMLSIYGLEYPAPASGIINNSVFSPRATRSIPSVSLRLSQFRHKLLRQSGNKLQ